MRIIGGKFRGKKLFLPQDKNTRPLKDLVKESIFNLISHSKKFKIIVEDSQILDLFSGSGSFGIECLSRGAKKVVFCENHLEALEILNKNLKSIYKHSKNYEIYNDDCFKFLEKLEVANFNFDIIFIDPPYKEIKIDLIIEEIHKKKLIKKGVLLSFIDIKKMLLIFQIKLQ